MTLATGLSLPDEFLIDDTEDSVSSFLSPPPFHAVKCCATAFMNMTDPARRRDHRIADAPKRRGQHCSFTRTASCARIAPPRAG